MQPNNNSIVFRCIGHTTVTIPNLSANGLDRALAVRCNPDKTPVNARTSWQTNQLHADVVTELGGDRQPCSHHITGSNGATLPWTLTTATRSDDCRTATGLRGAIPTPWRYAPLSNPHDGDPVGNRRNGNSAGCYHGRNRVRDRAPWLSDCVWNPDGPNYGIASSDNATPMGYRRRAGSGRRELAHRLAPIPTRLIEPVPTDAMATISQVSPWQPSLPT